MKRSHCDREHPNDITTSTIHILARVVGYLVRCWRTRENSLLTPDSSYRGKPEVINQWPLITRMGRYYSTPGDDHHEIGSLLDSFPSTYNPPPSSLSFPVSDLWMSRQAWYMPTNIGHYRLFNAHIRPNWDIRHSENYRTSQQTSSCILLDNIRPVNITCSYIPVRRPFPPPQRWR